MYWFWNRHRGANITMIDISEKGLNETAKMINNDNTNIMVLDISDSKSGNLMVKSATDKYKFLDILLTMPVSWPALCQSIRFQMNFGIR